VLYDIYLPKYREEARRVRNERSQDFPSQEIGGPIFYDAYGKLYTGPPRDVRLSNEAPPEDRQKNQEVVNTNLEKKATTPDPDPSDLCKTDEDAKLVERYEQDEARHRSKSTLSRKR
jgi:hypothetical protein